jgi:hypothetical protein
MKVAIFSPYATVVPHFETELDIAQQHLDSGDIVEFINCTGCLANCDFNKNADPQRCQQCIGRRKMGLELLDPRVRSHNFSAASVLPNEIKIKFESVAELANYRIENFDIGYAALSSLVSICRDPEPDLEQCQDLLKRFLLSSWQTYKKTRSYLATEKPDRVYVFNGRFAAMRAVFRACQAVDTDCFLHERGCDNDHYEYTRNHMLHDIPATETLIRQTWSRAEENPLRTQLASQWYEDRVNRVERNWHSFVKGQEPGQLPDQWNPRKKNVTIFCSSDDEFVAVGDGWKNRLYSNQLVAISRLAEQLGHSAPRIHLTLRVHPNLKTVDNRRKREMLALDFKNLTVIPPDAPVDSYELMRASDTVATFGSSVGIEAVYWDRPSVLLGPSFYQNLGGSYRPETPAQAVELLTRELKPRAKEGALMYGFWQQTRGHRHQFFTSSGLFNGQFKGQTLYAHPERGSFSTVLKKKATRLFSGILPTITQ